VDRPMDSLHPEYGFKYRLNYGFCPDYMAGDNEEIDAYILHETKPLKQYDGIVVAIIKRIDDIENKLVVARSVDNCLKEYIEEVTHFQEQFFHIEIICLDEY